MMNLFYKMDIFLSSVATWSFGLQSSLGKIISA